MFGIGFMNPGPLPIMVSTPNVCPITGQRLDGKKWSGKMARKGKSKGCKGGKRRG